jgi:glycine C-acetyltransferase
VRAGVDPYQKVTSGRITTETTGWMRDGKPFKGLNFASQDYLSLASHPHLVEAVVKTVRDCGVHSAGSSALMGNTEITERLERRLAEFLGYAECTVFPTGWTAGYGIVRLLAKPDDFVLIDILAHACLQEGANAASKNVSRFPHLSNTSVERRLKSIREKNPDAGILVVTETLFSMDSDVPNVAELQAICTAHGATLLVDCAHDLGAMGPTGRGMLEIQGMVGKVDVLMGSFSKTFASIGGFVATQHKGFKTVLRFCCGPQTFTNAMTPQQAAVILAAFDVVDSPEGDDRRTRLAANSVRMRESLARHGFELLGLPSSIVPAVLGESPLSRTMTKYAIEHGGIVNLVEYPAVSKNQCRWRLQIMADHTADQIDGFVEIAVEARTRASALLA